MLTNDIHSKCFSKEWIILPSLHSKIHVSTNKQEKIWMIRYSKMLFTVPYLTEAISETVIFSRQKAFTDITNMKTLMMPAKVTGPAKLQINLSSISSQQLKGNRWKFYFFFSHSEFYSPWQTIAWNNQNNLMRLCQCKNSA